MKTRRELILEEMGLTPIWRLRGDSGGAPAGKAEEIEVPSPASGPAAVRQSLLVAGSAPVTGHRSIRSTQIYLHLSNDWLADEYRRAAEAIDAQQAMGAPLSGAGAQR